jgi:peptidoglycan/LPS O-acetylase OafA/YrhL
MNEYVQYLRGIAALFVVFHHTSLRIEQAYGFSPIGAVFSTDTLAYIGVNLFFCLSGFLMASISATTPIGTFAWHRIARIYPAFFMAIGITFALCMIFSGQLPQMNWWSLTLFPLQLYGPLQVEWTLNYELTFYAMTAPFCLQLVRRYHMPFLVFWMCCILIAYFGFNGFGSSQFPAVYELPFSVWCLSFVMGGLTYYALRIETFRAIAVKIGPCALVLAAINSLAGQSITFAQPFNVAIVLAAVVGYAFTTQAVWKSALLDALGNASYGIYLIHQVVSAFAMSLLARSVDSPLAMWGILLGLTLTVGLILGAADVRAYRRLRRWGNLLMIGPKPHMRSVET